MHKLKDLAEENTPEDVRNWDGTGEKPSFMSIHNLDALTVARAVKEIDQRQQKPTTWEALKQEVKHIWEATPDKWLPVLSGNMLQSNQFNTEGVSGMEPNNSLSLLQTKVSALNEQLDAILELLEGNAGTDARARGIGIGIKGRMCVVGDDITEALNKANRIKESIEDIL
ncbi:hypothetical protein D3C81_1714340 [compost metagenome]